MLGGRVGNNSMQNLTSMFEVLGSVFSATKFFFLRWQRHQGIRAMIPIFCCNFVFQHPEATHHP